MPTSISATEMPAYFSVSGTLLTVMVPPNFVPGSFAQIYVTTSAGSSNTVWARVNETTPGVFAQAENGLGVANALQIDKSIVSQSNPAVIGQTIYLDTTGLGAVLSSPGVGGIFGAPTYIPMYTITATIGGVSAVVSYPKLSPLTTGLYQIAVTVPAGVSPGNAVPLVISGPDATSAQTTIAIAAP